MAKTKKQARAKRKEAASEAEAKAERPPLVPHPPRKNIALLVLTAVLLFGFLIYLVIIAWTAMQS